MCRKDKKNKDPLTRYTFRYAEKLHDQKDFKTVLSLGRKMVNPAIFIYIYKRKDADPLTRMGLVTSGKLGIAADRNRLKRRLREIFRLNKAKFIPGLDLIFIPKIPAMALNFEKLQDVVLNLFSKAEIFVRP